MRLRTFPASLRTFIIVIFCFAAVAGFSQQFPVRITPTLAPPFSPFLTDLTSPGSTKLLVHVTLTDPTVNNYRCKLRLTIEGVNITITTNPAFNPLPITLNGGVPELFYGSDLVDYFRYQNLLFQGISRADLERSGGKLPEGIYRFTLEVLDYNRGTVVSNAGTATAWMILNDPPIINTPLTNATITPLNPQNVVFQWTPRHRGSPNAAFTTEYVVRVAEIWPANRNPNDAIATTQPILETVTSNSLFVYSIAETPLVIGRSYALQVQARDTEGRDLFRNNGYSEVVKFTYGEPCPLPTQVIADQINVAGARMRWNGHSRNSGYRLRYREKAEGAHWFEENLTNSFYTSRSMKPGATYEYEVCGVCQFYESEFTPIQTFTTPLVSPTAFVCGNPDVPVPLPVGPPIRQFFTHDTISAAGFSVIVTKVQLNGELLSGEGHAIVPWFNHAKVRVTFKNITVNAKHELLSGTIESVWDPNSKFLLNSSPKTDSISYVRTTVALAEIDTVVSVSGMILTVTTNPDGDIVVQTTEGEIVIPHEEGKTVGITDQMGNGYVVDAEGHVTKTTADEVARGEERGDRQYSSDPNKSIRFIKATNTQYGLDEKRTGTLASDYQQVGDSHIAWKALATGETDVVKAVPESGVNTSILKFKVEGLSETVITPTQDLQVSVRGQSQGTVEELLAYEATSDTVSNPLILAKLNLASYSKLNRQLVMVKVNDAPNVPDDATAKTELNKIYSQAVVNWTSVRTESLTVTSVNTQSLDDGGSGILSSYTGDMRSVINAYFKDAQPAADTYYIFFVHRAKDASKLGFMPRRRQAGFVFTAAHSTIADVIHTMAHELGHGAFRLEHTFAEHSSLPKGVTDNLMDYGTGTRLNKYQWDNIHDPVQVLGLFEGDEEGASLCTWWYRNVTSRLWPNADEKILEEREPLFVHIRENFDSYFAASQADNKDITGHAGWSARKSSFSKRSNLTLVERVVKKFIEQSAPSFELSSKGIFLSEYTIEGKKYQLALYSEHQSISLEKTQVNELCALVDHKTVKIILEDHYILISFFRNNELQMTLQILANDDDDATLWLKYMGILAEAPTILEQIREYWDGLLKDGYENEKEEEVFLDNVQYVSQFDESIFGLCTGCWTNTCCRRAAEYMMGNTNIANCSDNMIAANAPYMAVTEKIITASFSNNMTIYTSSSYNSTVLNRDLANTNLAIDYIKERIDSGKPVLIGVHYTSGTSTPPNNSNRATRHFMVVVGYGKDGQKTYFRFYDPGRSISNQADATSPNNKLIFDPETGFVQGSYFNKTYTLTEVSKIN